MMQKILICAWAALANSSSSYCFPWVLLLPSAEPYKILPCSTFLCHKSYLQALFPSIKINEKKTPPPQNLLCQIYMWKKPRHIWMQRVFIYILSFSLNVDTPSSSQYWLMFQSKPSPSTQMKQQPGCLFTDTFLRWSRNPALLEHSPTPGEMPGKAQMNSLERLTHPLVCMLWANEISVTHAHIIGLFPFSVFFLCGIWDTSKNVLCHMLDSNTQMNNFCYALCFFHIP